MPEELLHRSDIGAALEEMGRETMSKSVASRSLVYPRASTAEANRALNGRFVSVVAPFDRRVVSVVTATARGKHVLPTKISPSTAELPLQGVR